MNATMQKDLEKLKRHVEACPSIPPNSLVSRIVLQRLDEKLHSKNKHPTTANTHGDAYAYAHHNGNGCPKKVPHHHHGPCDTLFKSIRIIIIDIPLTLLFLSLITTHLIHTYYTNYVTPMIEAARWQNSDRLESEYTYYDRPCDVVDITASSIQEVTLDRNDDNVSSDDAVENFMIHGMSLFTDILDEDVSLRLRTYIRMRNLELTDDEVIPLDTPDKRYSFGIDANEDPSVAEALNQIGTHTLLKETLEKLLGEDPAVAEITAITVEPGARAQGWHPDVKPLGSSIKYGQTFTHSYSLFIPLQNVTKRMGATELCPGTHYCGGEYLEDMCVKGGFQASESNDPNRGAWKTGDGLMMNQKMWHRGGAYYPGRNMDNPDRVVFILTFISRPNFGRDHRQLSHGTYFHIHPFMYGHTFQDLKNAQVSMSFPFSMLRSIGIWKPKNANWGYDWVTTSALRISNGENGYHYEDLQNFVSDSGLGNAIPSFLHGDVNPDGGWVLYIEDTIFRFRYFFAVLYAGCVMMYFAVMLTLDCMEGFRRRLLLSSIKRTMVVNIVVLYCAYKASEVVKETQFCKSVEAKTIYAKPFLDRSLPADYEREESPTTIPIRSDVLFGIRYDSKYIGNYINFLNYHPGNKELRQHYSIMSDVYDSYKDLPSIFQNEIIGRVDASFDRFLAQNDFGEWTIMEEEDKLNNIVLGLTFSHSSMGLMNALDREVAILLSSARFGTLIRSSIVMKKITIESLKYLRDNVIRQMIKKDNTKHKSVPSSYREINGGRFNTSSLFYLPNKTNRKVQLERSAKVNPAKFNRKQPPELHKFEVGDDILFNYQGSGYWIPGELIQKEHKNYGHVEREFDDGLTERSGVYLKHVFPYIHLVGGQKVALITRECNSCPNQYFPGIVSRVYPDFSYDIEYESGDIDVKISGEYIGRLL